MTYTHVADAAEDDEFNEGELEELWDDEELGEPEEDEDDLWLEGEET